LPHGEDVVGSNPPDSVVVTGSSLDGVGSGVTRSFSAGTGFLVGSGVGSAVTSGVGSGVAIGVGSFSQIAHRVEFPVGVKLPDITVVVVAVLPQPRKLYPVRFKAVAFAGLVSEPIFPGSAKDALVAAVTPIPSGAFPVSSRHPEK
jgi:hypothetical protein